MNTKNKNDTLPQRYSKNQFSECSETVIAIFEESITKYHCVKYLMHNLFRVVKVLKNV